MYYRLYSLTCLKVSQSLLLFVLFFCFFSLHQMTPLHVAAEKGDRISIVKYLVDKGAGINIKDDSGVST